MTKIKEKKSWTKLETPNEALEFSAQAIESHGKSSQIDDYDKGYVAALKDCADQLRYIVAEREKLNLE